MEEEQKLRDEEEGSLGIHFIQLLSRVRNDIKEARIYMEWDNKSAES